jgi:hypothetical protein
VARAFAAPALNPRLCVSGLLAPLLRRLDFLAGAGVRRHAASLLVERSAAQAQGMSCEHVGKVGLRIDAVELACFDQRGDAGPVFRPLIRAELILPGF